MNASGRAIRLLTLNVNGLGGPSRAAAMLEFVVSVCGQPDVVCLQELHVHDASILPARLASGRGPGLPYKCAHFASLGTSHARGVAVLLSSRISGLAGTAIAHASDPHGRLVRVDLTLLGRQLSLVSLYAPNAGLGNAAPEYGVKLLTVAAV
jgi:exonuclease III